MPPQAWLAMRTKSRQESVAASDLERRGIEFYLPRKEVKRQRSDRVVLLMQPLFPGYLFVDAGEATWSELGSVRGSVGVVRRGSRPALVPPGVVDAIRKMIEIDQPVDVRDGLIEGTPVRIVQGCFAGLSGVLVFHRRKPYLGVHLEMMGRTVLVPVERTDFEPVLGPGVRTADAGASADRS